MYGTPEVDNRAREFEQSKKALIEHALDVSTKDHSSEREQRARKEVGRSELQVNFKTHLTLAGLEGWASRIGPGKKQARFWTKLLRQLQSRGVPSRCASRIVACGDGTRLSTVHPRRSKNLRTG